jgi:transcriptional regulator of met regulon
MSKKHITALQWLNKQKAKCGRITKKDLDIAEQIEAQTLCNAYLEGFTSGGLYFTDISKERKAYISSPTNYLKDEHGVDLSTVTIDYKLINEEP